MWTCVVCHGKRGIAECCPIEEKNTDEEGGGEEEED
jgi:hypothetical protein